MMMSVSSRFSRHALLGQSLNSCSGSQLLPKLSSSHYMLRTLPLTRSIIPNVRRVSPLRKATRPYATMTDTDTYKFNHSMIRVKDPKASVAYYELLGMKLIDKLQFPEMKFDVYFMGYDSSKAESGGNHRSDREGLIELTHNYGTENDPEYKVANGNNEPAKGFGHTCISVDNIQAACQRISDAGYKFQKRLQDGRQHNIAFALDPDDYWVEVISQTPAEKTEGIKETDTKTYRMNHTMLRVKDKDKSLQFYQDVMGMKLRREHSLGDQAKATLYFLAYGPPAEDAWEGGVNPVADREGILELTYNWGSENDPNVNYHNGNDQPQGFGHIAVSVDNVEAACKRFEEKGVAFKKKPSDGKMKHIAFILDPDGYWIEIIPNERITGSVL